MLRSFACFYVLFLSFLNKKGGNFEKYKHRVFVYIGTCVPWMIFETKFVNFVSLIA